MAYRRNRNQKSRRGWITTLTVETGEYEQVTSAACRADCVSHFRAAPAERFRRAGGAFARRLMLDFRIELGATRTTMIDSHIHVINPTMAPSEP
jgi:hypothetical protein